ncbi:MAG TPA: lysophospholipid acyltransferase family protein [Thermodesulfovibrionales bacterium]|nr:lysophospholipid acyltransferase family protein [Thermodesulfovibrionales bacterium]
MKRLRQFLSFAVLLVCTFPLALLPYQAAIRIGDVLGLLAYILWRGRRKIALDNLQGAMDRGAIILDADPRSIIRKHFMNLGRSLIEIAKIYYGFGESVFRRVEVHGEENYRAAEKRGKGVLCVTAHCGNWELLAVYVSMNVAKITIVARRQDNPFVNRFIERTREKYGNRVIYKEGALKGILSSLKRRELIGILIDQSVIRSEGLVVPFLGKNAYAMKTPAILARKTGTPVVPAFIRRTGDGRHIIEIGEEIQLDSSADSEAALMQDTVNFLKPLEEYIRKYPSDWLWIHRRWKRIKE